MQRNISLSKVRAAMWIRLSCVRAALWVRGRSRVFLRGVTTGFKARVLDERGFYDLVHGRAFRRWFRRGLNPRRRPFRESVRRHEAIALKTKNVPRRLRSCCGSGLCPSQGFELGLAFWATCRKMPWLAAIEASSVLDIDLGLGELLPSVLFLNAIWVRGVCFASSWSFSFRSRCASASFMLSLG